MSVRVYCGVGEQPCPAHAWWYTDRPGRPLARCPRCRPLHYAVRRRENHRNDEWKRRVLASAASLTGEGG